MRIGVDARNLVNNITGISRYVLESCRALSVRGHDLFLYIPELPKVALPEITNAEVRISDFPGAVKRMLWAQTVLPKLAKLDRLDVFWGPGHRLPSFLDPNIPRVVTIHDLVWHEASATMRMQTWLGDRFLMKPALRNADLIIAVSNATSEAVATAFPFSRSKLRTVYPGLTSMPPGNRSRLDQFQIHQPFALFVGTLEPRKNLVRLLEAYAQLPQSTKSHLLLVIAGGDGWKLENIASIIKKLEIEEFIRLTGYISDEDLSVLYQNARFLIMPSIYEGFGLPIIEANAFGTPVITSNLSSMPEVSGGAALLVDPFNLDSISQAIVTLAANDSLHRDMTNRAVMNAARFEWDLSAANLEDIFKEAISAKHKGN